MTKGTPYALFVADATREALTAEVDDMIYVAELPVRGRTQPIKLWSFATDAYVKADWEAEGGPKAGKAVSETPPPPDSAPVIV
jgi:hypothetical protein